MTDSILGLVLAGGRSTRMGGGHKTLLRLGEATVLDEVIRRAKRQVKELVISANDPPSFAPWHLAVIKDVLPFQGGPMLGVLSGMLWARENKRNVDWVISFPGDTPFFPRDSLERLLQCATERNAKLLCAASQGQPHYAFALWSTTLLDDLHEQIVSRQNPRLWQFFEEQGGVSVDFGGDDYDPFFNINTPEDLQKAQALISQSRDG